MLTEQGGLCRVAIPNFLRRRLNIQVAGGDSTASFEIYVLSRIYNHRYRSTYSLARSLKAKILKSLFIDICTGKAQRNVYMIYRRIEYS
jgi:hypothetical protein